MKKPACLERAHVAFGRGERHVGPLTGVWGMVRLPPPPAAASVFNNEANCNTPDAEYQSSTTFTRTIAAKEPVNDNGKQMKLQLYMTL